MLGVSEASIWQWENNRTKPRVHLIPRIYDFLGYALHTPRLSFGAWLAEVRKALGVSRKEHAKRLRMDVTSIDRWERELGRPTSASRTRVRRFLERL